MAQVTIAGGSYVITSKISMDDLRIIKKHRPAALSLIDKETKNTIFKIGIGSSSLNDYGITFSSVSNDENKLATATLPLPQDVTEAKSYVLDTASGALSNLNKVEENLLAALEEIKAEQAVIKENIKIIV